MKQSRPQPYAGGGAAQQFASDRQFHQLIQAETACRVILEKRLVIKCLRNHDLDVLDSFAEASFWGVLGECGGNEGGDHLVTKFIHSSDRSIIKRSMIGLEELGVSAPQGDQF